MRIAAIAIAATVFATPALAGPYADVGEFATFTFGGNATASTIPTTFGTVITTNTTTIVTSGTEELEAVNGFAQTLPAPLTLSVGANAGVTFSIDYDRGTGMTAISDPADGNTLPAGETGTLNFTLMSTDLVSFPVSSPTLQVILLTGGLTVTDSAGFYDTLIGDYVYSLTISMTAAGTTYSMSVSLPGPDPVPEPGVLAVAGVGVLGAGIIARRRTIA